MALSCRTTRILHTLVTWSVILAVLPSNQLPNMDPYVGNVALIYTMGSVSERLLFSFSATGACRTFGTI